MNWYLKCLKQYANFSGRASREEYWMFVIFNVIFAIVALILDNVLGIALEGIYGPLCGLYVLVMLIPALAVTVRRLHDVGVRGGMILIVLIPFIGGIWLLVLMLTESNYEENQAGTDPKDIYTALIQNAINEESIKGIIPINPQRLKLQFANISFAPALWEKFVIALLCFTILIIPTSLFAFILGDLFANYSGSKLTGLAIFFLYWIVVFFVAKGISSFYIKYMKRYIAKVFFVISDKDLHCIIIENYRIKNHHNFNIEPSNLGKHFYGEINKKTKRVKERFELHIDGITQAKGKISLKNGQLYSEDLPFKLILPLNELQKIYLS